MSYDGHLSKRQRTDDGMLGMPGSMEKFDDPHKPAPSCVVHVRGLSESAIEADLVEAVQHFGTVRDVIMMPRKRQALIEFEKITGARNCVDYAQTSAIYVAAQPAFFNFSTSQKIQRPGDPEDTRPANHVLLFTILNPQYPITVDVMHTICSPYGQVLRIVIFKKNGVQAMVEFDSVESAKRGKQSLNGADIYSGCCTLKIEYAKPTRLNVVRNDNESRDYTNPNLGADQGGHRGQPLLADPRMGGGPTPYNGMVEEGPGMHDGPDFNRGGSGHTAHGGSGGGYGGGYGAGPSGYYEQEYDSGYGPGPSPRGAPYNGPPDRYGHRQDRYGPPQHYPDQGMMGPPSSSQQGAVVMVYGLNMAKLNCERLFNLFCLYGNVVRVKFLKSKEGSAMVQLGDGMSVERAILNLHNTFFFDNKMQLSPSKQAFLQDVMNPHELPDGTPSYMDFMGNRNNRFTNPEAAKKNRVQGPAKVLHFFNTPPGITAEDIEKIFEKAEVKKPMQVKLFPSKKRSSSGLAEFDNKADAVEALVMCNHTPVENPGSVAGKNPFIMKLCFSSAPIIG
ncbi:heterogeneous nuclear ribonucleoprotein L-like isoform X2 [Haliotis rufescens]|uniref:heterogeneous nuclear ribonucleoprotein L-like isoform X2 n=1 Tax=Haliotis rufescens TaxID=6454 RepID=UPI001EAF9D0F|nr:heterogeneous nuclear ribonucleoprotein L-like isoform X2 [Haliotis rufescens]